MAVILGGSGFGTAELSCKPGETKKCSYGVDPGPPMCHCEKPSAPKQQCPQNHYKYKYTCYALRKPGAKCGDGFVFKKIYNSGVGICLPAKETSPAPTGQTTVAVSTGTQSQVPTSQTTSTGTTSVAVQETRPIAETTVTGKVVDKPTDIIIPTKEEPFVAPPPIFAPAPKKTSTGLLIGAAAGGLLLAYTLFSGD